VVLASRTAVSVSDIFASLMEPDVVSMPAHKTEKTEEIRHSRYPDWVFKQPVQNGPKESGC
jgi:hypothetical protein